MSLELERLPYTQIMINIRLAEGYSSEEMAKVMNVLHKRYLDMEDSSVDVPLEAYQKGLQKLLTHIGEVE